jgi:transposase-like protein
MDEKQQMISEWQSGQYSKAALARRYGVSRTTLYKWIERYEQAGREGLTEGSRALRRQGRKTSPAVVEQIVGLRAKLPHRGAGKLKALWEEQPGQPRWPARSTVAGILKQQGLTRDRRRRRIPPSPNALRQADAPNRLWCADCKGWFTAGDGSRCEPRKCYLCAWVILSPM